jgi:hypothetical protein
MKASRNDHVVLIRTLVRDEPIGPVLKTKNPTQRITPSFESNQYHRAGSKPLSNCAAVTSAIRSRGSLAADKSLPNNMPPEARADGDSAAPR